MTRPHQSAAASARIELMQSQRRGDPSPSPPVRAVVFDIGGVLERVGPPLWLDAWRARLGLNEPEFDAALARVDPDDLVETGGLSEAEMRASYAEALGLSAAEADELMADIWDWYCGELDEELVAYVRGLRPRVKTGILSNSADGARREEAHRYGFPELVDDIVYSHEVGLAKPDPAIFSLTCTRLGVEARETVFVDDVAANVESANRAGFHAVLHKSTAATVAAIDALIGAR
jgi:HAD superfamily hydrolase (TIGR01509 family)